MYLRGKYTSDGDDIMAYNPNLCSEEEWDGYLGDHAAVLWC